MIDTNQHYIYVWKESKFGLPFYIGHGRHSGYKITNKKRYLRAYRTHYNGQKSKDVLAYCQRVADSLALKGTPHTVEILYDNLTLEQVNNMERILIKRLGRRNIKTGILCNLTDGGEQNPMDDADIKKKHKELMGTKEQSMKQKCKSYVFNGIEYYSKNELSRTLGISKQLLTYRERNNIPFDLKPDKGNDPNGKKMWQDQKRRGLRKNKDGKYV